MGKVIDEKTIKNAKLSDDDILDVIQEATGVDRITAGFIRALEDDEIDGDIFVEISDEVQSVIDNAPTDDEELGEYLKDQLKLKKISLDEFDYVLQAISENRETT